MAYSLEWLKTNSIFYDWYFSIILRFIVIYNTHLLLCMYIVLNKQTRVPVNYSDPSIFVKKDLWMRQKTLLQKNTRLSLPATGFWVFSCSSSCCLPKYKRTVAYPRASMINIAAGIYTSKKTSQNNYKS
jgi:hypothetical protein